MFELKIPRNDLEDLVMKMALPTGNNPNRKDEFVFETIAPKITPQGYLEWIGKTKNITVWVRAKGLEIYDITEPVVITLKSREVLNILKFMKGKNDIITITHDTESGEDIFTTDNDKRKRTIKLPSVVESEAMEKQEKFPGQIDKDGIVVYKGGRKPDLYSACDVSLFKELVANTKKLTVNKDEPNIYHIIFDEANNMLRTIASDTTANSLKTVDDEVHATVVKGTGTVHFAMGFPEVMNALDNEIELYALVDGPLWIVQDSDTTRIRYLIPPARYEKKTEDNNNRI
jgi:hypothetical protein